MDDCVDFQLCTRPICMADCLGVLMKLKGMKDGPFLHPYQHGTLLNEPFSEIIRPASFLFAAQLLHHCFFYLNQKQSAISYHPTLQLQYFQRFETATTGSVVAFRAIKLRYVWRSMIIIGQPLNCCNLFHLDYSDKTNAVVELSSRLSNLIVMVH